MEFVYIEAKTFMEMNEALEAIARRVDRQPGGMYAYGCLAKENVTTPEKRVRPLQLHRP